ncbi:tail fiber domain-containing protein [Streptomyces sp. NPDC051018]|uniref:tail fiber domain-containing protein n=1 Tax=Streptomyces sp. NPDC051018 TaxID=3365639 RepID=UPI0037A5515E
MSSRLRSWLIRRAASRMTGAVWSPVASTAEQGQVQSCEPVNGFKLLDEVLKLPVSTWRYTADPPEVRHLGPMAQDWWAAFGVGVDDKTICCTDANGVSIVAIQALHRLLAETQGELVSLREQVDLLRARQDQAVTVVAQGDVAPRMVPGSR